MLFLAWNLRVAFPVPKLQIEGLDINSVYRVDDISVASIVIILLVIYISPCTHYNIVEIMCLRVRWLIFSIFDKVVNLWEK